MNEFDSDIGVPAAQGRTLRETVERCPEALIAVFVAMIGIIVGHFFSRAWLISRFALTMPGAIRRANGRHLLVALACTIAASALDYAWHFAGVTGDFALPYIVIPGTTMLLASAMEWFLRGKPGLAQMLTVLVAALGAAAVYVILAAALAFTEIRVTLPALHGSQVQHRLIDIVAPPLQAALLWVAIPIGLAARSGQRRFVFGTFAAAVALYFVCFKFLIFMVAERSLAGRGPMSRAAAAEVLARRVSEADLDALWQAVKTADWSKPSEYPERDYDIYCIDLLAKYDRARTARRLSELLKVENKSRLAAASARLIAEYRHCEAVPVLLRFACCFNDHACKVALEKLQVPQAAFPVLYFATGDATAFADEEALRQGFIHVNIPMGRLEIDAFPRSDLAALLGNPAANTVADWTRHYDQVVNQRPTPLSEDQAQEANRVVQACREYFQLRERWFAVRRHRVYTFALGRMRSFGLQDEAELVENFDRENEGKSRVALAAASKATRAALSKLHEFITASRVQLKIKAPAFNCEATGVAGLEREVARYKEAVIEQEKFEFGGIPSKGSKAEIVHAHADR